MYVGVGRVVLQVPGARSLKDRRRVVKSFKDRVRAKLPVSIAEVGDMEHIQVATLGFAVVSNEPARCDEILAATVGMARVLPDAVLADVRTEVIPVGLGGRGLDRGLERALDGERARDADPLRPNEDWDDEP